MSSDRVTIGFLGLGLMGLPMAVNLAHAGYDVVAWNRSPVTLPDESLPEGTGPPAQSPAALDAPGTLRLAADVAEVGRSATIVISMLTDLPPLVPHVLGDGEHPAYLLGAEHRVETLVVMSTCSPTAVAAFAEELATRGVSLVDAPVSGGVPGASDGTLSIMVGASEEDFLTVRPVLEAMGRTIVRLGPIGAGALTKACNQMVVNTTVASLAEAVLLAERSGLDVATVIEALSGGLAGSAVLEWKRTALTTNDFTASGPAKFVVKDLGFAADAARAAGVHLPVTDTVTSLFTDVVAAGMGDLDNSVVLEHLRHATPSS